MKRENIDRGWTLSDGLYNIYSMFQPAQDARVVNLPHDYMVEMDVTPDAIEGTASGFHNVNLRNYNKKVRIPAEWADEKIYLKFDGVMMNATVDVNGAKVGLQHYGYAPVCMDITEYVYPGEENRICITTHAGTQPNSRWYSGAGIYRELNILHGPKLHIADDGIYAYTKDIAYDADGKADCATIKVQVEVANDTTSDHTAVVEVSLSKDNGRDAAVGEKILTRKTKLQINAQTTGIAYVTLTVDDPLLWDAGNPNLYRVSAKVTDAGVFKTHEVAAEDPMTDEAEVLFGIRTVTADVRHGLRINGKTVKLKGGCLHHDNGLIGTASLYDVEYRKLSHMKATGFNAVRTTHNPPSKVLIEAADRLGMYVFDEAFDAWDICKEAGDYSQYFATDWQKDLTCFIKRDRSAACVVIWSTGNEIPERGGLDRGYARATELAAFVRAMDGSRPISNAICSFWSGLDESGMRENLMKLAAQMQNAGSLQNADAGKADTSWEEGSWAFTNGLDIVGYNYMEDKYPLDHKMYPERVILGSENYPKEIGIRWPMVESTDYVLGDFTWTAYDYIGEAGIGQAVYMDEDDPRLKMGQMALTSQGAGYPWRTANDADFDINGELLPQGAYRSVVWGSEETYVYSYAPEVFGKREMLSAWGFPAVTKNWNWKDAEGKKVNLLVFTKAEEAEVLVNGRSLGRKPVDGQGLNGLKLPRAVLFETEYAAGEVVAISYTAGKEVSRDTIVTTKEAAAIRLTRDTNVPALKGDGHSVAYVKVEIVDADGRVVPDAEIALTAEVTGAAVLAGFGSGAPKTTENYYGGHFTTYHGTAMAIVRDGYEQGESSLTVRADGFAEAEIRL